MLGTLNSLLSVSSILKIFCTLKQDTKKKGLK